MARGEVHLPTVGIPTGSSIGSASCRYCGIGDDKTDIYLVMRDGEVTGFCLECYGKHLHDKRKAGRDKDAVRSETRANDIVIDCRAKKFEGLRGVLLNLRVYPNIGDHGEVSFEAVVRGERKKVTLEGPQARNVAHFILGHLPLRGGG